MNYRKIILTLLTFLMLGQSVLASADVHLVFEGMESAHHLDDGHAEDTDSNLSSVDDCGHSCHSHASGIGLFFHANTFFGKTASLLKNSFNNFYLSPEIDSSKRPPIA